MVVEAPVRGFVVAGPGEAADAAQLVANALEGDGFHVDGYAEGHGELFPAEGGDSGIGLHVVEGVGKRVERCAGGGLDGDAEGVFLFVVAEAAPGGGVFGED